MAADYFLRRPRGHALAAELDTPERAAATSRSSTARASGPRLGTFRAADVDFMTEPFADPDKLRAGFGIYETALGTRPAAEPPRLFERSPVPTLLLYGPEDHVIQRDFPARCEVAFTERVGPFVVEGAGHYLQWERADVLNQTLVYFCADLRGRCPSNCRAARRSSPARPAASAGRSCVHCTRAVRR